jgi:hypothetical protein
MSNKKTLRIGQYVLVGFVKDQSLLGTLKGVRRTAEGVRYDIELRLAQKDDGAYDYTIIENIDSRFVTSA